jgi:molybdopterin converting factor small subunit
MVMKVNVRCFSSLASDDRCGYREETTYSVNEGDTVEDLVHRAGVAKEKVKVAFVNSRAVDFGTVLVDGDRVGLTPAVGGM